MIDLDITVYDMFDLPPLSEYEVYIKNFGSDNTQQVSSKEKSMQALYGNLTCSNYTVVFAIQVNEQSTTML